jgi:uncharacterized protein YbaA (DUF1428 family)
MTARDSWGDELTVHCGRRLFQRARNPSAAKIKTATCRFRTHPLVAYTKAAIPAAFPTREKAMSYIDGFVIAVPNTRREQFIAHANKFDAIFMEFGATRVMECWGDDVPEGKLTDFRRAVQAEQDESVVFSWVEWPDKATRDAGMEKFMKDPRMADAGDMPFDGKRMIFGGFAPVISLPV